MGRRVTCKTIYQLDSWRDTGVCGASSALLNSMLRCSIKFYTYLFSHPPLFMCIYLCILCLSTFYIAGVGRMLEEMKISTAKTPQINLHPRTQKGKWRNTPKKSRRLISKYPIFHRRKCRKDLRVLRWVI